MQKDCVELDKKYCISPDQKKRDRVDYGMSANCPLISPFGFCSV